MIIITWKIGSQFINKHNILSEDKKVRKAREMIKLEWYLTGQTFLKTFQILNC